jgi:hypothetical protein
MKFISESPESQYGNINYNGLKVLVNINDMTGETVKQIMLFCDKHCLMGNAKYRFSNIYYLRGYRWQVDYTQVLVGFLETGQLPPKLNEVIHCLSFWNQEGTKFYPVNQSPGESYPDFILRGIAADCRALVQPYHDLFTTGRDNDKVWISDTETGDRILLIHF